VFGFIATHLVWDSSMCLYIYSVRLFSDDV